MQITSKDVGRRVNLRNGDTATIIGWNTHTNYTVHGIHRDQGILWTLEGYFNLPTGGKVDDMYDIVSFVEDTPAFKITEADIKAKRKVKLRNGTTVTLRGLLDPNFPFPVTATSSDGYTLHWNTRGHFDTSGNDERDMITFVEDTLPLTLTINDVLSHRNVLLRDGRKATLFAWNDSSLNCYSVDGVIEGETQRRSWTIGGKAFRGMVNGDDIVGFVEEPVKANDFIITQADCQANRKVLLRDGRKATLAQWDYQNMSTSYKVDGHIEGTPSLQCWTPTGVFSLSRGVTGNDIVGFVEEAAFIITEADCKAKRKVKLRCGIIAVLTQFRGHKYTWPVEGQVPNVLHNVGWKTNGAVGNELGCANDIVGFVEEAPPCKQMRDLTMEEIGALVGTHNFKLVHNPALIRTIWHNMKHIWEKNNQADILIAPVGTEDWKPMQKEC